MRSLVEEMDRRIMDLKKIIQEKESALIKAPRGVVNIAQSGKKIRYYYKDDTSAVIRKYLKKEEEHIAKALCQKDYDQKILKATRMELSQLEQLRCSYPGNTHEEIYGKLNDCRKRLVKPTFLADEEYVKEWMQKEYPKKEFKEGSPEYYTDKGERVRSKTEILIANALNKFGIPYHYECPLYLEGYGIVHPDFTALNIRLRKLYYWEHNGMMDDPDYLENALYRITMYEKNDIYPGDKLIITHETSTRPINSKSIEAMIQKFLL